MSRSLSSRLRSALLGAAAAALVLTTTTALAGSGVGGVFNLGQVNTVDAQTSLSGNPGGSPELKVTSTGTAAAVRGVATTGIGTNGISTSGVGQQGLSTSGIGTLGTHGGTSGNSPGVQGETNSTDPAGAGVVGKNNGGGPGLRAIVNAGAPPLAVNSAVKVTNLNTDLMDGLDSLAFQKRVTDTCGAGSAIKSVNADGTVVCEPVGGGGVWSLTGNSGTTPGTNFLGTTDNAALELQVNGQRALRIEPTTHAPNLIGGFAGNSVDPGVYAAVIGGGGGGGAGNRVAGSQGTVGGGYGNLVAEVSTVGGGGSNAASGAFSTVGGGYGNTASGQDATVAGGQQNTASNEVDAVGGGLSNEASGSSSTVAGGYDNTASGGASTVAGGSGSTASGNYSFAAGLRANASDAGSFVWGDSNDFDIGSNGTNTFTVRSTGGASFVSGIDGTTGAPTAGVSLAAGGGSWSSLSDRAAKRDLAPVDRTSLLARLDRIPIPSWSYRSQRPAIRHLGPMAQDFRAAFGLGEDNRHIDTIDSEGVALAAIQGLYRQNQGLQQQNRALRAKLQTQGERLSRLERALSSLSRR
jgi:hypothetical protein